MRGWRSLSLLAVWLLFPLQAFAAGVGEISDLDWRTQAMRFLLLQDGPVRYALAGSIFLGIACGLLGSFIVVRKMALMGDTLSHAVLPGVVLGFMWEMTKDPLHIFIGAVAAGLLGTAMVSAITQTTRIKEETALGIVLAAFFAIGICLLTMLQSSGAGAQSGLDKFLFGQAAALGPAEVKLMGIVAGFCATVLFVFFKEFLTSSFDPGFACSIGMPVRVLHYLLMLMLAFAVVISLQAVGVVMVSAMLVTPAAAAYLFTDRMSWMLGIAAFLGGLAGALGAFISFLGNGLPTGPFTVLSAAALFAIAFAFSPRHGLIAKWWKRRRNHGLIAMGEEANG